MRLSGFKARKILRAYDYDIYPLDGQIQDDKI
jgi:hypothetical protein